ncbi:SMI1/KNR4 family protein [Kitasatospora sp. NPDC004289]
MEMKSSNFETLDGILSGSTRGGPDAALDSVAVPIAEQELGFRLPSDYVEFMSRYGAGGMNDFTWIARPTAIPGEPSQYISVLEATKTYRGGRFDQAELQDSGVSIDRLVQWGGDSGGNDYLWLVTGGDSDAWPVVIHLHGLGFVVLDCGMVEYIVRSCRGELVGRLANLNLSQPHKFVQWQEEERFLLAGIDPWTGEHY